MLQRISDSEAPGDCCGWDGARALLLDPFRQDGRFIRATASACRSGWTRTMVRVSVDNIYPTDSEIVIIDYICSALLLQVVHLCFGSFVLIQLNWFGINLFWADLFGLVRLCQFVCVHLFQLVRLS